MSKESINEEPKPLNKSVDRLYNYTLARAEDFTSFYHIERSLDISGSRLELFNAHFARYLLLKENYEFNYNYNHPVTAAIRQMPILRKLIDAEDKLQETITGTTDEFDMEIKETSDKIRREAVKMGKVITTLIDRRLALILKDYGLDEQVSNEEDAVELLYKMYGSPREIEIAANRLSTAFIENNDKPDEEQQEIIYQLLDNIHIGE